MFVITTPHSWCSSSKRDCDTLSERTAIMILTSFIEKGIDAIYLPSDQPRNVADLNRNSYRDSKYRENLRNFLHKSKPVALIDVHSFLPHWLPEAGRNNIVEKGKKAPELVILQCSRDDNKLAKFLSKVLSVNLRSEDDLGILIDSNKARIPAVLLEFNEELKAHRLKELCVRIADAMCDFFETS